MPPQVRCVAQPRTRLVEMQATACCAKIHPEGAFYTWFDYRGAMFQRKLGLRIDHILTSSELAATLTDVTVDLETRAQERPSDHAPVNLPSLTVRF